MIGCVYISADCSVIGDREFDCIGQKAVFSESGYREAVLGGSGFIPETEFSKIGFTEQELKEHGPVGMRCDPPADFCNKLHLAQEIFRDIRARMVSDPQSTLADFPEAAEAVSA
jgi:hypothetical protein